MAERRHNRGIPGPIWMVLILVSVVLNLGFLFIAYHTFERLGTAPPPLPDPVAFSIDLSEDPPPQERRPQMRLPEPEIESVPAEATVEDRFSEAVEEERIAPPEPAVAAPAPRTLPTPVERPPSPTPPQAAEDEPSPSELEAEASPLEDPAPLPEPVESGPQVLFPRWQDTVESPPEARAPQDRLEDVTEGETTLLNRKHTRYWSFFDRLRDQIRPHWHPREVMLRHDPHGNVFGVRDRATVLHITLTSQGALYHLRVLHSSGVDVLDQEALRAVRAAAPFPNPPPGLQDPDGMIRFTFGFHLEVRHGQYRGPNIRWR